MQGKLSYNLLRSATGTRRYRGNRTGDPTRDHPECRAAVIQD